MRRTQALNKRLNLFGAGKHGYSYNDDIPGMDPTYMTPDSMNDLTEEACNLVEGSGQTLSVDGADRSQLLKAVKIIAGQTTVSAINASATLTPAQRGLVTVDATGGNVVITLPSAAAALDYIIRRLDNTGNKVTVQCDGTEKILHNTHVTAAGYGFIRLFGAGDFWWLRSNQVSGWWPLMRLDPTPIGRLLTETGTVIPPGGYTKPNGTNSFLRSEFPWLWDYAGISGNLHSDANWIANRSGGYSTADGATTFRVMEIRGEFIRVYDDGRGVDSGRVLGSVQLDAMQNITGTYFSAHGNIGGSAATGAFYATGPFAPGGDFTGSSGSGAGIGFDASRVVRTAAENRPGNLPFPMLVKII